MKPIRSVILVLLIACCTSCLIQRKSPDSATDLTVASLFKKSADEYAAGDFESSLASAHNSRDVLNRQLAIAHNNICSAHIGLEAYDEAILACRTSLELSPDYERARQNLTWVYERMQEQTPSAEYYVELSLLYYQSDQMDKSIIAAQNALLLKPRDPIAYNNICAAHAQNLEWGRAIRACEKALEISPGYELAQANLDWARKGLADSRIPQR